MTHAPTDQPRSTPGDSAPTLTEVLSQFGYTHRPPRRRGTLGKREILRGDEVVATLSAGECWDWLRETGQVQP